MPFSGGLQTAQKSVQKLQRFFKNVKEEKMLFLFLRLSLQNRSAFLTKNASLSTLRICSKKIHTSENFVLIALDYPILQAMVALKEVPELHDKIIVSTAKYLKLPIITKDKTLQKLPSIKTVW